MPMLEMNDSIWEEKVHLSICGVVKCFVFVERYRYKNIV